MFVHAHCVLQHRHNISNSVCVALQGNCSEPPPPELAALVTGDLLPGQCVIAVGTTFAFLDGLLQPNVWLHNLYLVNTAPADGNVDELVTFWPNGGAGGPTAGTLWVTDTAFHSFGNTGGLWVTKGTAFLQGVPNGLLV